MSVAHTQYKSKTKQLNPTWDSVSNDQVRRSFSSTPNPRTYIAVKVRINFDLFMN
jgi:hypothetical protein